MPHEVTGSGGAGAGSVASSAASSGANRSPAASAAASTAREPLHALVPVHAEQLGVERDDAQAAAATRAATRGDEVARVGRAPARPPRSGS